MPRTLVVILCQTRGWKKTWDGFKAHVLDPLNADLAVVASEDGGDPFCINAKYKWFLPDVDNFADAIDAICSEEGASSNWRQLLSFGKGLLLGGVKADGYFEPPGSGAISLIFRWFMLKCLEESGVVNEYDYFIVTRSDHIHVYPHFSPPVNVCDGIWIPMGEDYGGITDRHIVVSRDLLRPAHDLMRRIVHDPDQLLKDMIAVGEPIGHDWNIEKFIDFHFCTSGLYKHLLRFPRTMFTIRCKDEPTRWAQGIFSPELDLYLKYIDEYSLTINTLGVLRAISQFPLLFMLEKPLPKV